MKNILPVFCLAIICITFSSCSENYSNGERIGYLTKFSHKGAAWKSWEGELNVTQTGMNTSSLFEFSVDNDHEDPKIVATLDSAANLGWKIRLTYHETLGKNWFGNRGETSDFVSDVKVLDRTNPHAFNGGNSSAPQQQSTSRAQGKSDTVVTITVTLDEARKMGWLK